MGTYTGQHWCMAQRPGWATTKSQEVELDVNEMRMLRWMCEVTTNYNIRSEHVIGSVQVEPMVKEITGKDEVFWTCQ